MRNFLLFCFIITILIEVSTILGIVDGSVPIYYEPIILFAILANILLGAIYVQSM